MKPLVSIVITLYNYEKYIADCIRSCLNQTYKYIEIIVVDDYSTDNSKRIASKFLEKPNVRLLTHGGNKGYAAAKNSGIIFSKGEFVALLDADDCMVRDGIEKRVDAFSENIDVVHGNSYNVSNTNWTYSDMISNHKKLLNDPVTQRYFKKQHRKKIHAQSVMLRRTVFERFGLFWNIKSKSDKEYWYRIGIHPLSPLPKLVKCKKIDNFVSYYRRKEDSMKGSLKKQEKLQLKEKFNKRIEQLKNEGVTKNNTEFL